MNHTKLPGILLCLILSAPAWFLGRTLPIIGGPVFGILLGLLTGSILVNGAFKSKCMDGIRFTSKFILQYSIILLGFEMNLFHVIRVGGQSLVIMLFTLTSTLLMAYFAGKALKIEGDTVVLVGVGTCICGGSAIAATAPVIQAKEEDVAQAISTIFLFNILAVFLFPALGHALELSDTGFGIWAGTAINDTSSVVAAGVSWSSSAGNNTALSLATIVKLTRTLMIIPITLVLAVYTSAKNRKKTGASEDSGTFNLIRIFPWFVLGFIATAVLNTLAPLPGGFSPTSATLGKFMIVMAMVAIGLNTNFKKLLTNGIRPILLGLLCWFTVASVSLAVQYFMGTL